jgi:hypothetical protein
LHQNFGEHGRQDYLIVRIRDHKFYLVEPPNSQELLTSLRKSRRDWPRQLEGQGKLFLELPLVPGKGFPTERGAGVESGSPVPTGFDSWLVKERRQVKLDGVKANIPLGPQSEYSLVYGLNKSERTVEFVPGLGITAYEHDGYAGVPPKDEEWEGHCKLIEYHRGLSLGK